MSCLQSGILRRRRVENRLREQAKLFDLRRWCLREQALNSRRKESRGRRMDGESVSVSGRCDGGRLVGTSGRSVVAGRKAVVGRIPPNARRFSKARARLDSGDCRRESRERLTGDKLLVLVERVVVGYWYR
ncbi:MAG: hypothetical protein IJ685_09965 [Selenomonadaceae bacterium]|nr:hypothetical protein [Selenomonadaceae bacterium]